MIKGSERLCSVPAAGSGDCRTLVPFLSDATERRAAALERAGGPSQQPAALMALDGPPPACSRVQEAFHCKLRGPAVVDEKTLVELQNFQTVSLCDAGGSPSPWLHTLFRVFGSSVWFELRVGQFWAGGGGRLVTGSETLAAFLVTRVQKRVCVRRKGGRTQIDGVLEESSGWGGLGTAAASRPSQGPEEPENVTCKELAG